MAEVNGSRSWTEELASLVDDPGYSYSTASFDTRRSEFPVAGKSPDDGSESLRDQVQGFLKAWGEMVVELGRGCRDIVQQSLVTEDSFLVRKLGGPCSEVGKRLRFLNDYCLPEDRDPVHSWTVILLVFLIAFAVLIVNTKHDSSIPQIKKVSIHPTSASRVVLPDGRHMAYRELGVPADRARFSLIAPHPFLSSRLAGIPGIRAPLLEEFGVRLVAYDLPGFGESDPHPIRNLNSSALDMLSLAEAVGVKDKFWVLGYSSGAMHAWAALRYIPDRIAGAAMFAPMVNLDERRMTKEERQRIWDKWVTRRKLMYFLARRFPGFLAYLYRQTFLSGKHGPIDKWLAVSLGERDKNLVEEPRFEEFWHRDVEESIRQGDVKPFIEEAVLQVSNWGFSLADLQVQRKCLRKGILPWLKSMYSQAECDLTGFQRPIHIWQGMDDEVVPPAMTDYSSRILAGASVHKLPNDGHFSYFFFCNECHRQILTTLFGSPQGPLKSTVDAGESATEIATTTNEIVKF